MPVVDAGVAANKCECPPCFFEYAFANSLGMTRGAWTHCGAGSAGAEKKRKEGVGAIARPERESRERERFLGARPSRHFARILGAALAAR